MSGSASNQSDMSEVESKRSHVFRINKRHIPLKLLYFFFMAGECCSMIYYSLFLKHLGMSAKQTGIISTLQIIISVVSPPVIGGLTDKTKRPKIVLIVLFICAGSSFAALYFIPQERLVINPLFKDTDCNPGYDSFCWTVECNHSARPCHLSNERISWNSNVSVVTDLSLLQCKEYNDHNATSPPQNTAMPLDYLLGSTTFSVEKFTPSRHHICSFSTTKFPNQSFDLILSGEDVDRMDYSLQSPDFYLISATSVESLCYRNESTNNVKSCQYVHSDVDEYGLTFWTATVLGGVFSFALVGIYPVVDATVLGVLGEENRYKLGLQRVWASVGYGVTALILGYARGKYLSGEDGFKSEGNGEFRSMFLGALICWTCAAIVSAMLPIKIEEESENIKWNDVKTVMKRQKTIAFFGILFFYGFDSAIQELYLFWFAEEKLSAPSIVLGTSLSVGAFTEIPFCLSAGYFIKRFGHTSLLCFGMAVFAARIVAPAVILDPWFLVGTESLRGITWGLTWVVVCSYTSKISPKRLENSTMGITQGYIWGVAYGFGSLVGGVMYQSLGGDFLFLSSGIATAIATMLFGIYSICSRNPSAKKPDLQIYGDEMTPLGRIDGNDDEEGRFQTGLGRGGQAVKSNSDCLDLLDG